MNLMATHGDLEIMVCSDVENDEFHKVWGVYALKDTEKDYISDELGSDFILSLSED